MEKFVARCDLYRSMAWDDLREMELLAGSRLYRGAISRAYYAFFHAMSFLLAQHDIETKSHKQTHIEFRRRFVKDGPFGAVENETLSMLFTLRQSADYDPEYGVDLEICESLFTHTKQFVEKACGRRPRPRK